MGQSSVQQRTPRTCARRGWGRGSRPPTCPRAAAARRGTPWRRPRTTPRRRCRGRRPARPSCSAGARTHARTHARRGHTVQPAAHEPPPPCELVWPWAQKRLHSGADEANESHLASLARAALLVLVGRLLRARVAGLALLKRRPAAASSSSCARKVRRQRRRRRRDVWQAGRGGGGGVGRQRRRHGGGRRAHRGVVLRVAVRQVHGRRGRQPRRQDGRRARPLAALASGPGRRCGVGRGREHLGRAGARARGHLVELLFLCCGEQETQPAASARGAACREKGETRPRADANNRNGRPGTTAAVPRMGSRSPREAGCVAARAARHRGIALQRNARAAAATLLLRRLCSPCKRSLRHLLKLIAARARVAPPAAPCTP